MRRYNYIGADAKTGEDCTGSVDGDGPEAAMNDHTENAPKRKWTGIVVINAILLLTAGLLILHHLTNNGLFASLVATMDGTPTPTPIGPGIDLAAANHYFNTTDDNETLISVSVLDDDLNAKITLKFYLDATLTSEQVDAFAMKQAIKADRVKGWKYQPSTTHVEIFIYDPPQLGIEDEWTYRLTYVPFDVYHGMVMDDRSDQVRTRRAAQRIAAEELTP